MSVLFELSDKRPRPNQRLIEVVHAKEQKESIARLPTTRAAERRVLVGSPLVKAQQDRTIGVENLTEVVVSGLGLGLAKQRLVPPEAARNICDADDGPRA